MFLYMIMFVMQKIINHIYKMDVIKQINIKNRTFYFCNNIIDLENFDSSLLKIDKTTLVFTTLDILQRKKLMFVKIFAV